MKKIVAAVLMLLALLGALFCFPAAASADEAYVITSDDVHIRLRRTTLST